MSAETACDARWHIYWLELSLWGQVFHRFLLPERQDHLLATFEAAATHASPEDPQAWDALLSLIHPGLRNPAADTHPNTIIRIEVRFHRAPGVPGGTERVVASRVLGDRVGTPARR